MKYVKHLGSNMSSSLVNDPYCQLSFYVRYISSTFGRCDMRFSDVFENTTLHPSRTS